MKTKNIISFSGCILTIFLSFSTVRVNADPPVLDADTNTVTGDNLTRNQVTEAFLLYEGERLSDEWEDAAEEAALYGEEPYVEDPENPGEYLTGNEYLENNASQIEAANQWRDQHPETE
jgi:hypothetical protein